MTADELDRLEALAFRATPGPWVAQSGDDGRSEPWYIDTHAYPEGPEPVWAPPQYPVDTANAAFIAACDPDTIRRLVQAAREPLDAAWAEAEAALPEGWAIEGVVTDTGPTARPDEDYCANAGPAGEWLPFTEGRGPTPAAALRALAAALRKPVPA